jgi:hypothetical protein
MMAFGADAAESEDKEDDEPYTVPPVHACWFDEATEGCSEIDHSISYYNQRL